MRTTRSLVTLTTLLTMLATLFATSPAKAADGMPAASRTTSAWLNDALRVDTADLLSRSDLVLATAPWRADQAVPLANGELGAGVWAANGWTAQLNRGDTFPELKSAGQLVLPDLYGLSSAEDYRGRLSLHDATLTQHGNGMTVRSYVRADADQLVVEVVGADPDKQQTAELGLWEGRTPIVWAHGDRAAVAETFTDESNGRSTGQLAALTAQARDVRAEVVDELGVRLTFRPGADGRFRIVLGVPSWAGGDVAHAAAAATRLPSHPQQEHLAEWHRYWEGAAPMRLDSPDGSARYFEALRAMQLYVAKASSGGAVPASHGGVTSLWSSYRDDIHWSSDAWWHFNLRQPVWANLGADTADQNTPYFDLYLDRIEEMKAWTQTHWPEAEGICVPEFLVHDGTAEACVSAMEPSWLNRILSTGAELVENVRLQSDYTGDRELLRRAYPLLEGVAEFYLSVLEEGEDGRLHLHHVNALETQWDTTDPTPDVAGMRTIFPFLADVARENGDVRLAEQIEAAIPRLPELPTTVRDGKEVIAWSATDEEDHNTQNPDLEAIWPWRVVGAEDQIAHDTFTTRVFDQTREWASDAQQAAWLHRADDMVDLLAQGTSDFQVFDNGFAAHSKNHDPLRGGGFYDTWNAVVASTVQDALVQDDHGTVRIAPSVPENWSVTGAVQIPGGHRVDVEVRDGAPTLVGIEAGSQDRLAVANPWPGRQVEVRDARRRLVAHGSGGILRFTAAEGASYRVAPAGASYRFEPLGGSAAQAPLELGSRTYGVATSTPQVVSDTVRVLAPSKLRAMLRAQEGAPIYVDRAYVVSDLPDELAGTIMVRGANNDSKVVSDDYLTLEISEPTTVWVAFDDRGEDVWWPQWLTGGGWTRTSATVGTTDRPLVLFRKEVPAGTLTLGGNSGVSGQGGSSYVTFVREP